jgi:hypothetical protein
MFSKHTLIYFLGIFLLSITYLTIGVPIFFFFKFQFCLSNFISILVVFVIINLIFHSCLILLFEKRPNKFLQIFLLFTISKIMLYVIFLIIYLLNLKYGIKCFLISFLLIYMGFTIYEVTMLSRFLKNKETK